MKKTVLDINNLTIGYTLNNKRNKIVAENINLQLREGEFTCLLGVNGAGKSTLLKTICAFNKKINGNISLNNKPIEQFNSKKLSQNIGVVLTEKAIIHNITVREIIAMGRAPYSGYFGGITENDIKIIDEAIISVGIEDLQFRLFENLSDGERQKVMITKALVQQTPIIVLDEPTAFLDLPSKLEITSLLHKLAKQENKAILLSTHDLDLALNTADKIWLMGKEKPIISGIPEDLIRKDYIENYFAKEDVYLDKDSFTFKIKENYKFMINYKSENFYFRFLKNALKRNKILLCNSKKCEYSIDLTNYDNMVFENKLFYEVEEIINRLSNYELDKIKN